MAHVTFDTLKFVETLKKSGVPDEQAKAFSEAQKQVFTDSLDSLVASKSDIIKIEARLRVIEWMIGVAITGIGALILKAFF